ncbi:hypothetical protein [Kineococcus rhizosphaerae]|uniref:Uncharacterized protein n=1 Tax=Kineococcus rhizosphaerae TaxID=559628 RepID=A0A2T0R709_9ACTN|nr:hypothetical protein [Kineococcus rhizosphaerae]PRY16956.1 hypothetical protein CLV37_103391 [Kineococcus rhizosphaerae]
MELVLTDRGEDVVEERFWAIVADLLAVGTTTTKTAPPRPQPRPVGDVAVLLSADVVRRPTGRERSPP